MCIHDFSKTASGADVLISTASNLSEYTIHSLYSSSISTCLYQTRNNFCFPFLVFSDAVIIPVGCTPLQLMVAASTVTTPINGTYIMPLNGFGEKGSIVAFEFYASKAGILRFQVSISTRAKSFIHEYII